jgi:anti-sigma factor RsiW
VSPTCPPEDDLIALLDGEATENRAADLRAHLQRCASCQATLASFERLRDAVAELSDVPEEATALRILEHIQAAPAAPATRSRPPRRLAYPLAVAGVLAVAAAAAIWPRLSGDPGTFAARGRGHEGAVRALHRDVGVTVRRGAPVLDGGALQTPVLDGGDPQTTGPAGLPPLADGEGVSGETTYAVTYRNLGAGASAFLMVLAVDSAHAVHWIHPAYLDAGDDPSSVPLDHAVEDQLIPATVTLDSPASGELRVITLVTPRPLRVSQIEALSAPEIAPGPLRARFPEAEVAGITLHLR